MCSALSRLYTWIKDRLWDLYFRTLYRQFRPGVIVSVPGGDQAPDEVEVLNNDYQ